MKLHMKIILIHNTYKLTIIYIRIQPGFGNLIIMIYNQLLINEIYDILELFIKNYYLILLTI